MLGKQSSPLLRGQFLHFLSEPPTRKPQISKHKLLDTAWSSRNSGKWSSKSTTLSISANSAIGQIGQIGRSFQRPRFSQLLWCAKKFEDCSEVCTFYMLKHHCNQTCTIKVALNAPKRVPKPVYHNANPIPNPNRSTRTKSSQKNKSNCTNAK